MKITRIAKAECHIVHDDIGTTYTRWGPDNWSETMGESEEQVCDCTELEQAFQQFITPTKPFPIYYGQSHLLPRQTHIDEDDYSDFMN